MKDILKNSKGFTLVELLTVISIIAILTGILSVSYISISQRGRDGQRKSNIKQIQAALELYKSDMDSYPAALPSCGSALTSGAGANLVTYMIKIPCDPAGGNYYYSSPSPYSTYTLSSCLDNVSDKDKTAVSPGGGFTCSSGAYYTVINP